MEFLLCSECFQNLGIKTKALFLGFAVSGSCPHCSATNGRKLTSSHIEKLYLEFFIYNSCPTNYYPPMLDACPIGDDEEEVILIEESIRHDMEVIRIAGQHMICRNVPKWYEVYQSNIDFEVYECLEEALKNGDIRKEKNDPVSGKTEYIYDRVPGFLCDVFSSYVLPNCTEEEINNTSMIFRARCFDVERFPNPINYYRQYDSCPISSNKTGRFHQRGEAAFYGSFDIDTCLLEIRPSVDSIVNRELTVAMFHSTEELRVLDISQFFNKHRLDESEINETFCFLYTLFWPDRNYLLTQLLAGFLRGLPFDGLVYPSALRNLKKAASSNIVLWGSPYQEGKIQLASVNKVLIRDISYKYELGPSLFGFASEDPNTLNQV